MTLEDKLIEFRRENGFPEDGGASEKIAWFKIGFIAIPLPNFKSRQEQLYLHDISHVLSGFPTTLKGEGAVGGWEIASGGWKNYWGLWYYTYIAFSVGAVFFPKATKKGFYSGLNMYNGMTCDLSKEEILQLPQEAFEETFKRSTPRSKSYFATAILALSVVLAPLFLILIAVGCYFMFF